jgi:hypothetical protein
MYESQAQHLLPNQFPQLELLDVAVVLDVAYWIPIKEALASSCSKKESMKLTADTI